MSEIEKLYKLAGIEHINFAELRAIDFTGTIEIGDKRYLKFTAEKQLELIKWCLDNYRGYIFDSIETEWFEEQLCAFINEIWQDLTEEEKQQVKGILE